MKELRKKAEAAQSAKLHRLGAQGNMKKALKGEHARRMYASGGAVAEDGGDVEGGMPKPRLDRPSRGGKKGAGKKGTNVNVVIMQHPPGMGGGAMPPGGAPMPMAGPPPPMPHPMAPPMGGPPPMGGAGGPPPMPMRKDGGRVARKSGGKVEHRKHHASGGEAHEDAAEDKKMIKGMVKEDCMKRADGGKVVPFESKASKEAKMADEHEDKDLARPVRKSGGKVMTAGAGSGEGRLEKADMQHKFKKPKSM